MQACWRAGSISRVICIVRLMVGNGQPIHNSASFYCLAWLLAVFGMTNWHGGPDMSHIDPVDIGANVATGGLYGVGKGAVKAIETGKVGAGLSDAAASYGPFGSIAQPTIGTENTLKIQGMTAGAALGAAGPGAFSTSGFGAAAPSSFGAGEVASVSPYYFGFDPDTLASAGTGEFGQFAGGVPTAGMNGAAAGALAGPAITGGSNGAGALLGAQAAHQLGSMALGPGGASPLSFPQGGAMGGGTPGSLTPAQLASLSAMQSEAHKGLAPRFEQRQSGSKESPGIASMSQYYNAGGQ